MTRFDKILWRTNGLLILGGVLLGCAGVAFVAIKEIRHFTRDREVTNIATPDRDTQGLAQFSLGDFYRISGTALYEASLRSDEKFDRSYYSKSSSSVRNTCLYDAGSKTSRWLFPSNHQIIVEHRDLHENPSAKEETSRIIGRVTCVIEKDSDGDNRFTPDDKKSVYLHDFSEATPVRILEGIDSVNTILQRSADEILIFTQESQKRLVYHIDTKSRRITARTELAAQH